MRTHDSVHVEVWLARTRYAISKGRQRVGLGHRVKDGNETSVYTRHDAFALHAELEVGRY